MSSLFFNDLRVESLQDYTAQNKQDDGSGLQSGTTITFNQKRSFTNWALGDTYKTFDTGGSSLSPGDQYPEFIFRFREDYTAQYLAFGNHTLGSQSDGWILYGSSDGVTYTQVAQTLSTFSSVDSDYIQTITPATYRWFKIVIQNPQTNFKIGVFSFCSRVDLPYLSAKLTMIQDGSVQAEYKHAYGDNYHTSRLEQSFDNMSINLKNLNKTWIDQNASLVLAGIRYPFVFYYDFLDNTIQQEAAYCLQVGQSKGVSINTNHLYSLPIKTVSRSWS